MLQRRDLVVELPEIVVYVKFVNDICVGYMYALPFSNKILQAGSPKFVRSSTVSVYDLLSGPKRYWRFVLCFFTKRYCMEVSNLSKKNNFSIELL